MKRITNWLFVCLFFPAATTKGQLATRWASAVNANNALPAYPRPQMARDKWTNLNGTWDYAITEENVEAPARFEGSILVPYPIESVLSGVKKALQPSQRLWYRREIAKPILQKSERLLLHFGAVDFEATVFVNGKQIGRHTGGYTAFSFDVTDALHEGKNELVVKVYDPTDQGPGPRGKQVLNPQNIYYTATSGIWQTVWMETVPAQYITSLTITPDIDSGFVAVTVHSTTTQKVTLASGSSRATGLTNEHIILAVPHAHLWTPSDPFLYDLVVKTPTDEVKSYFGMRKISIGRDGNGFDRLFLNNHYLYNLGVLDQGFWPDGLYTAPTDEALAFDIKAIKSMGFNTIRKHIKVEPDRWYYWADKLGMIVWQDFVQPNPLLPEGSKPLFEKQIEETITQLYNHPSITTWVLFNEKWGQYDQQRLSSWVKKLDPTRLLNAHSGEMLYVNDQLRSPSSDAYAGSDLTDVHSYPDPRNAVRQEGKARVLGEFGGIGVFIPDHQWLSTSAWGYIQVTPGQLESKYRVMNAHLQLLEKEGLSASIYTQPFDVEGEQNGLMTYDRAVVKIPFEHLRSIHSRLIGAAGKYEPVIAENAELTDPVKRYAGVLQDYVDGKRSPDFLKKASILAAQAGDKDGAARIAGDYMAGWSAPYRKDQLEYALQNVSSIHDKVFTALLEDFKSSRGVLDKRSLNNKLKSVIYTDILKDPIDKGNPDWTQLGGAVQAYDTPGEEIYLRARTIYYLNAKDWEHYVPVARQYLDKYGHNLKESERRQLTDLLNNH